MRPFSLSLVLILVVILILGAVLAVVLIVVLIAVLVAVLVLILVLVIHFEYPPICHLRQAAKHRISRISGFILCFENEAYQ